MISPVDIFLRKVLKGHTGSVYAVDFDEKYIVSGSYDKTIKVSVGIGGEREGGEGGRGGEDKGGWVMAGRRGMRGEGIGMCSSKGRSMHPSPLRLNCLFINSCWGRKWGYINPSFKQIIYPSSIHTC